MKFLLILLLSFSLQASPDTLSLNTNVLKSAPQERFFPKVDIISGTYLEDAIDLVIAGNDPLSIRRFYYHTAPTTDTRYGFWQINPEASINANLEYSTLPQFVSVGEFSGGISQLTKTSDRAFGLTSNKSSGYNGQTHPLNTKITYQKRFDTSERSLIGS